MQEIHIHKDNEKGQATVEFIMVFAFALGITFLFLSLAINSTQGYMVQYANYMASRTFLSYDNSSDGGVANSINQAANVARQAYQKYPLEAFDIDANFEILKPGLGASSSLFSGTTAKFAKRLTPFKLVGGGAMVTFYAESFLSKEPVRYACWKGTCSGIGQTNCQTGIDATLFDNGC